MNKIKSALLVVCLFGISQAHAGNDNANPCGNNGNNCNATGGNSNVTVNSNPVATGTGGSANVGNVSAINGGNHVDVSNRVSTNVNSSNLNIQGQEQVQEVSNSGNNTGTANVTVQGDNYEARRIPVSTAYANAPLPSATCRTGGAVGIQLAGFGGTFGGDRAVDTCEINEASRIAFAIGQADMSVELLCQNKWAKKTSQCQALVAAE
jgi:hypothetical protein